jgi:hypothetical protein
LSRNLAFIATLMDSGVEFIAAEAVDGRQHLAGGLAHVNREQLTWRNRRSIMLGVRKAAQGDPQAVEQDRAKDPKISGRYPHISRPDYLVQQLHSGRD